MSNQPSSAGAPVPGAPRTDAGAPSTPSSAGQTFTSAAALGTFSGSTVGITLIWRFASSQLDVDSLAVPMIFAFVIAALLWLASKPSFRADPAQFGLGLVAAVVNGIALYFAVIGFDISLDQAGAGGTANPDVEVVP
jgi:hypothetical protein